MSKYAIQIGSLGKMYKFYNNPKDKIREAFGLNFWKKDYYQEFWAIRDLNLNIKKGERIGLIGCNGAGKSTLLKMIIGNIHPTEGRIKVNGNIQAMMELGTGFHPEFTGRENIYASLAYYGLSRKEIKKKEQEIIDFAELGEFIDKPIRTYSAGMNARIAFSTATAIEPEILIIDEVLGAGDAYFAGKCVERMRKLTEESGATVLFVSHDLNSVLQLCEKVIWLDRGKLVKQGDPLEVIKDYNAMIRKRDDYRLRARDLKVTKNHAIMLENKDDLYESILFHFVGSGSKTPISENKIYKIVLLNENEEVGRIDIGEPMDNSAEQDHYIIDTKKYMDWSEAKKDNISRYREFTDMNGEFKHAPLNFTIPKAIKNNKFSVVVTADIEEEIKLEVYDGTQYIRVGEMKPEGFKRYEFEVGISQVLGDDKADKHILEKNDDECNKKSDGELLNNVCDDVVEDACIECIDTNNGSDNSYEYGNKDLFITSVQLINSKNRNSKIFDIEEAIKVVISFETHKDIEEAQFVFCAYLPDGKCASQWVSDTSEYKNKLPKKGKFIFNVEKLYLGKGSYVASIGVFKGLNNNNIETETYHVIDRSVHFEIRQQIGENIEKGICIQPFKGMIVNE